MKSAFFVTGRRYTFRVVCEIHRDLIPRLYSVTVTDYVYSEVQSYCYVLFGFRVKFANRLYVCVSWHSQ